MGDHREGWCRMLSKPSHGWTDVTVSGINLGPASYVDDVPNLVLDTFISWFASAERGSYVSFCLEFDAEGYYFGIVEFGGDLYYISDRALGHGVPIEVKGLESDRNVSILRDRLSALGLEAVRDIRENIEDWKSWNPVCEGDDKLTESYKVEYLRKCDILESLITRKQDVQHETCISDKNTCVNTCENTCFTGNGDESKEENLSGVRRKVLVAYGLHDDKVLFITDAPKPVIEKWCRLTLRGAEDGECFGLDWFKDRDYYVRILFDTEEEIGEREDINVIGYDEVYDLATHKKEECTGEEARG